MERKNARNQEASKESNDKFSYFKMFWLFIFGSLPGVLLEGLWCLAFYGHWETHVVTVFEPLCVLYGFGMVGCCMGAVILSNNKQTENDLCRRFISTDTGHFIIILHRIPKMIINNCCRVLTPDSVFATGVFCVRFRLQI